MPKKKTPDAIALLKADHRKVEGLFAKFEKAREYDRKKALGEEICLELRIHATIEEDIFYPACREAGVDENLMDDEFYDAKVKVLSEMIKHHVKEEEKKQGNMFAKARKAGIDAAALGERMAAEKEQVMAKLKSGARPKPPTPSFQSTRLAA